jgi:hypothetical protein
MPTTHAPTQSVRARQSLYVQSIELSTLRPPSRDSPSKPPALGRVLLRASVERRGVPSQLLADESKVLT